MPNSVVILQVASALFVIFTGITTVFLIAKIWQRGSRKD